MTALAVPMDRAGGPWRRLPTRLALGWAGLVLVLAAAADLVARDGPLAARVGDEVRVLPGEAALGGRDLEALRGPLAPGEWVLEPLVPWSATAVDKGHSAFEAPSRRHWLGTDGARRDVLARLLHGTRVAVAVGLGAAALQALLGVLLGAAAGYLGGMIDVVVSRLAEVLLALPTLFLLLALMGLRGGLELGALVAVIGATSWMRIALMTRAEARRLRALELVVAAEALGLAPVTVLLRHVLPNSAGPAVVSAAFAVASAIVTEASLSFLGFGVPGDVASWGALLHDAARDPSAWWLVVFPGLALVATLASANVVGDAVREGVDPRIEAGG